MTDWSKYAAAPVPYDPTNDDAEFQRGIGNLPSPQPQTGPQLSDDEEFRRAMGQSATSAKQGTTDWSKIGTDAPAGSGVGWSKYPDAPPDTPPNYSAMPWSQVVETGVNNLLPSAWNAVTSVPQAIYNYRDTAGSIGQIAAGAASKAEGLFSQQDPAQKAQNEAAFNTLIAPYTSVAGFKKALAEDPFSVLTTAAIPLSGGAAVAGRAAEMLGEASIAGRAANAVSGLSKAAATASNPFSAVGATIGAAGRTAGKMATGTQQFLTGKPQFAFQKAAQAGAASAAGNSALSDAFNTFAKGNGDPVDLSQRVQGAVQGMKSDALNAWKQSKGNLINSTTAPVDLSPVWQSIQDARGSLSPPNVAGPPAQLAHKALNDAEGMVWDRALSTDPADRSLEGMDQLKQELREMYAGQDKGQLAENALKSVHAGVRQAIGNASPEYNDLMGGYQRILDDLQDVTKSAGASDKTAATTQLQKLVRAQKTPEGQTLISRLGERDPTIPYMLAGSALHDTLAGGVSGAAEKFSAPFHMLNIGRAMMSGDPADIGEALV